MEEESLRERMIRESKLRLFGHKVVTDDPAVIDALTPPHHLSAEAIRHGRELRREDLEMKIPGFLEAAGAAIIDLSAREVPVALITYFFGEVKAWPHDSFWVIGPSKAIPWGSDKEAIEKVQ